VFKSTSLRPLSLKPGDTARFNCSAHTRGEIKYFIYYWYRRDRSPEPESGTSGIQTLTCVAAGFLPRDLNVSWMVTGDVPHETESASLTVNSDGTFTLSSRLSLQTPDWHLGSAVTCQVQHITLIPPGTERISFTPSKSFCNKEWDIRIEKGANCSKRVK
uniref:Ig-like domain-containing protein n=1 Tax=Callorhinchus milii TaxID=7868 RepID=A0A4W3GFJ5_CALMI